MDSITQALKKHYEHTFEQHGPTAEGVDWGKEKHALYNYDKMLEVIGTVEDGYVPSLLDVGCGYGGLFLHAKQKGISIEYTGIDVAENMIDYAKKHISENLFIVSDIFTFNPGKSFDYVVCNGILTQKLSTSIIEMDIYAQKMISRMFELCNHGIAFNTMTTKVNFMVDNLYYRNPVDMLAFCISNLSQYIRLDHSYPLYEYTVYVYRNARL